MLDPADQDLRGALTAAIAELGHAPTRAELAQRAGRDPASVGPALERLHAAHALLLDPTTREPWVVHPFALSAGGCWVETARRGYWANCLYCAFGIAAALDCDATIHTRLGGEAEPARYAITDGAPAPSAHVFHLALPPARWWDNVIAACASFQPFAREADVDPWCARHALPRGAVLTLPALWAFARDWYGAYLRAPWRQRTPDEARALFARHGLTSPFWAL